MTIDIRLYSLKLKNLMLFKRINDKKINRIYLVNFLKPKDVLQSEKSGLK